MNDAAKTNWTAGQLAQDLRDGEVVEVLGPKEAGFCPPGYVAVLVITAGRGGPSGPSALAGERTLRALDDADYPFVPVAQ